MNPHVRNNSQTLSGAGPTDAALVVAARAGEMWACQTLFLRYTSMVNGLVYRLMGNDRDVEDLVQESFVAVLGSLPKLKEPQAFESYLASVTVRTVYSALRKRRMAAKLRLVSFDSEDTTKLVAPNAPHEVAMELKMVFEILSKLPPLERMTLILKRVEGYTLDEIVGLLGKSKATVKRKLAKAEALLVEAMEQTR